MLLCKNQTGYCGDLGGFKNQQTERIYGNCYNQEPNLSYRTLGAGLKPAPPHMVFRVIRQDGTSITLVGGSDGALDSSPIPARR
jgi:hypothetical protein